MKVVILSFAPQVRLVDVTHRIVPQDVMEAAYVLRGVTAYYPTVHLAVVDVGTDRRSVVQWSLLRWPRQWIFFLILQVSQPE